ncbi:MAG TPA: YihY/virulence factor BrkB family protein [Fredinandcohnia sp.]|nr:YihY/virulence factor BrkB family protein [Fredinandcohnia sp.]
MRLNLWGEVRWFARAFARKFSADSTMDSAASLAFFAILAFFPFLIGMVSLASLLMNPRTVEVLLADLAEIAPPDVTRLVGEQLRGLVRAGSSGILTLSSFGAYWAASGGMSALMRALNRVNEVRETRPLWKSKGISLLTTLVAVFFLLTAAIIAVATPAVARVVGGPLGTVIAWMRLPIAGFLAVFAWETLYHVLPNVRRPWRPVSVGSIVAVIFWLLASWGFSAYVSNFGRYDVTYGALGAFVVLILWLLISALVVIVGAQINFLLERRAAERRGDRAGREDRPPAG